MSDDTPKALNAADPPPEPSTGAGDTRRWGIVLAVSVLVWVGVIAFIVHKTPDWRISDGQEALEQGKFDEAVSLLCESDEGRTHLASEWEAAGAGERRTQMEEALFRYACLDLIPEAERKRFRREHAAWMLGLEGEKEGAERRAFILELLIDGEPDERGLAITYARRELEAFGEEGRAVLIATAEANLDAPWAMPLLNAMGDAPAMAAVWKHHQDITTPPSEKDKKTQDEGDDAKGEDDDKKGEKKDDDKDGDDAAEAWSPPAPEVVEQLETILLSHWAALPEEAQAFFVSRWLVVEWVIRRGGPASEPQPITFEVVWKGPPRIGPLADAALVAIPTKMRLRKKVRKGRSKVNEWFPLTLHGRPVVEHLGPVRLDRVGRWSRTLEMQPTLDEPRWVRLAGRYEVAILPREAVGQAVLTSEGKLDPVWREKALYVGERKLGPKPYRIFTGIANAAPKSLHKRRIDRHVEKHLQVFWSDLEEEIMLREGGKRSYAQGKRVAYRHSGYQELVLRPKEAMLAPLAFRVQATRRGEPDAPWRDVGNGILEEGELEGRYPIDLTPVCFDPGECPINLRMRPSLRVSRTDPGITEYWAEMLELGWVVVELPESGAGGHWTSIRETLQTRRSGAGEAPSP